MTIYPILAAMASFLFILLNGRGGYCTPITQGNGKPLGALSVAGCLDSDGSDVAAGVPEHKLRAGFPWWHVLRRKAGQGATLNASHQACIGNPLGSLPYDMDQTIRATSRNPFCVPSRFSRVRTASSIRLAFLGRTTHPSSLVF